MSTQGPVGRFIPAQLPQKLSDYDKLRKKPRFVNLNDLVEEYHRTLWEESAEYRRLHEAVWDTDAVNGSLDIDDTMAAQMVKVAAAKAKSEVAERNLATLVKCLRVIMRRYGSDRRSRRYYVGGENVTTESTTDQ